MNTTNLTVSIEGELPEYLYQSMQQYLEDNQDWTHDRLLTAAVSLFLLQNGDSNRKAARTYLDTLFGERAA